MKNFLKEKVKNLYEKGEDFYDLPYSLFGEDNVENWPNAYLPSEEEFIDRGFGDHDDYEEIKDAEEPQDMENFEWISVDDDEVVVCCGGDWQMPMKITLRLNDNNQLVVFDTENEVFEEGLSEEDFNELLGL